MATFTFNCPQCGNLLSGEDEWRGMESECPYCQKAIIIPVDKDYENSDIPQKKLVVKKQIWKILIPVVSICLIAVVVFLWSCNSSKSAGSSTGEKQQSSSIKTNTIEHSKAKSTESFAYHFRLPVTDDEICLELWSNLPGSIQKWIIVTQAGKRWKLHCKEQISQNINGKKMYVAQYFFPKAWYLDNLIFDPIASMELTVVNTESSNDLSFVLSDTDKVLFAKLNESITSPSSTQTFTAQSASSPKQHVSTGKMSLREKCHYFYKHNAEDNAVNRKLLKAASARDIIAFDEALKEGASLFAEDAYGRNALDILKLTNSTKTIEKVLETWYRENHRKICETTDTMTVISIVTRGFMQKHIYEELKPPLFYCKTREIAEVLLLAGAEINYQTPVKYNNSIITIRSGGDTALHFQLKNPEIVEFLLKNGANPNYADCDGRTPIFYTASPEIIDLLIRYKANINYTDHNGRTPLFSSNINKIKKLISNGAKLNVCDKNGNTLCHYVAEFHPDNIDLYNFFIRSGVNPKAKNQHNESAYDKCICHMRIHYADF